MGVEIVRSRYMIAEAALQRLAAEEPQRFRRLDDLSNILWCLPYVRHHTVTGYYTQHK